MKIEPPTGSSMLIEQGIHSTTILWRDKEKGRTKITFILFGAYLCIFSVCMLYSAIKEKFSILLFSIGIFVLLAGFIHLWSSIRAKRPFRLVLSRGRLSYKPGAISMNHFQEIEADGIESVQNMIAWMKKYKKSIFDLEHVAIQNLTLEKVGDRQRLTFDHGADRIEIGMTLSDAEKEWLYETIREHISGLAS